MNEQTITIDENISSSADTTASTRMAPEAGSKGESRCITALALSTLFLRIANRISFVILGFYLGQQIASATIIALILEAVYISEFLLAPLAGSLSDHYGRKRFLILAPFLGGAANASLLLGTLLFPHPQGNLLGTPQVALLLLILLGRLLEGATTALNTPVSLGYIADLRRNSERAKARMMTIFEIVTMAGLAGGILLGGNIGSVLGTQGFFVVIALHIVNILLVVFLVKEHFRQSIEKQRDRASLFRSLQLLKDAQILTIAPIWLAFNALIGAWMTHILIIMTYPDQYAEHHYPGQLLYGGFSKKFGTLIMGGTGLLFLVGMGIWILIIPRMRRTTAMFTSLGGLYISILALTVMNGMPDRYTSTMSSIVHTALPLIPFIALGIVAFSGFIPAVMAQLTAIAAGRKEKHGAIMGLYTIVVGVGQLLGAILGGVSIDFAGFYGLMIFSTLSGIIAIVSVARIRRRGDDLTPNSGKMMPE